MWTWANQHRVLAGLATLGVVMLALVTVVAVVVLIRSGGTPVNLRQALRLYRQDLGHPAPAAPAGEHGLPPEGVYQYQTGGGEQLNIPGLSRQFPSRTEVVVTSSGCGRAIRWEALQEHMEETTECTARDSGVTLASATTDETMAGLSNVTTVSCDAGAYIRPPSPVPGALWRSTCRSAGTRIGVSGEVIGYSDVTVGDEKLRALHTRVTMTFSGSQSGTNPVDYWLSVGDSLLLKEVEYADISQGSSALGSVHYVERAELSLLSTNPIR